MRSRSELKWVRLNFRVNDLEFKEVLVRPCEWDPSDFQLVIEHRFLGSFALHEEFFLEQRENDCVGGWRPVSLGELKLASLEGSRNGSGVTEKEGDRWEVPGLDAGARHANFPRIPVEGDAGHFGRAKEAFARGGVHAAKRRAADEPSGGASQIETYRIGSRSGRRLCREE